MIKNASFLITHDPERCRVPLPVELEALFVHCPIEVERQLGIRRWPHSAPA